MLLFKWDLDASADGSSVGPINGIRPFRSLKRDPRFSYCSYVPSDFWGRAEGFKLLLALHGSGRDARELAGRFSELAENCRYVVLAPLFPVGVSGDLNGDGYKYLQEDQIDYTAVIDATVEQFEAELEHKFGRLNVFGMSGGAQCAHRFTFVHPERVEAVSIAAPGTVTLPGDEAPWWIGTGDMEGRFGRPISLEALRKVRFHLLVGQLDLDRTEILPQRSSGYSMPGSDLAGDTRVARLLSLSERLAALGVPAEVEILRGVSHELEPLLRRATRFFARSNPVTA